MIFPCFHPPLVETGMVFGDAWIETLTETEMVFGDALFETEMVFGTVPPFFETGMVFGGVLFYP